MNVIIVAIGLLNLFDLWATLQWIPINMAFYIDKNIFNIGILCNCI